MNKANLFRITGYFLYLVFFISLFFSFRAISSFALGSILIWGLAGDFPGFKWSPPVAFLVGLSLYFAIGLVTTLWIRGPGHEWNHVLLHAGLLLTGLAIYLSTVSNRLDGHIIFLLLAASLVIVLVYCTLKNGEVLYYHELLAPAGQHAVYFSFYVFAVLVWLIESIRRNHLRFGKSVCLALIIFFSLALFFLSSKLVLAFYVIYLVWQLLFSFKLSLAVILLSGIILALLTRNPVRDRFRELIDGDMGMVKKENYDPGVYFNGLQFRLLQWKLVPEILQENNAWISGVGAGSAQELLDKKYRQRNMYVGDIGRHDSGYLGYNTHNQFLESLLQSGLIGLVIFIAISFFLLVMGWKKRSKGFLLFFILLITYAFLESVLETQHGIILFSFLPLLLYNLEETF